MNASVYIVNAFAGSPLGGNPAAVVPVEEWPDEGLMQEIAAQHNLAETAFVAPEGSDYRIRWFTPTVEIKLCGHATLAAAHVFFNHLHFQGGRIVFYSLSGPLVVYRGEGGKLVLDFPADPPSKTETPKGLTEGLGAIPVEVYKSSFDYLALFDEQAEIEKLDPDFGILKKIHARGVIATSKGDTADFVSRCFFPQSGVNEDQVTGSAHCAMTPYWSGKLGKAKFSAIQLSKRKGFLDCELKGDRVLMAGFAFTYLTGKILV